MKGKTMQANHQKKNINMFFGLLPKLVIPKFWLANEFCCCLDCSGIGSFGFHGIIGAYLQI